SAPSVLSVDFETRSRVDLKNTGAYVYARHPSTDIWCMAFAFDDEEVGLWTPDDCGCAYAKIGDDVYHDSHCAIWRIIEHVKGGGEIRAWNARFERMIWTHILGPRYGFPVPEMEQFVDTAAEAAAMALPRALEDAAKALGLPVEKDAAGARLMKQMAKPRRPTKNDPRAWWGDEDRRRRLYDYCKQDVRVERAVAKKLRPLSPHERELYLLDQKVNDRGVRVDVQLVHAAK